MNRNREVEEIPKTGLNSMQREEPYLGLTCISKSVKADERSNTQFAQVLHGCRQLVS